MATDIGKTSTRTSSVNFYPFPEFLEVCMKMKFTCARDYKDRFKYDSRLPSSPNQFYGEAWVLAGKFACVTVQKFYTFHEFLEVCERMKFTDNLDYRARYKQDSILPSHPYRKYGTDWADAGGWACVTGKKKLS